MVCLVALGVLHSRAVNPTGWSFGGLVAFGIIDVALYSVISSEVAYCGAIKPQTHAKSRVDANGRRHEPLPFEGSALADRVQAVSEEDGLIHRTFVIPASLVTGPRRLEYQWRWV